MSVSQTYHQVWWPPTDVIKHDDGSLPVWHEASGRAAWPPASGCRRFGGTATSLPVCLIAASKPYGT
jgi:hypothetical protein